MTTEARPGEKTNGKRDWATDYDIFDPEYVRDPYPIWDELREKCPVAHTDRWGESWMPTKYADLWAIAQDIEHFSSREILVAPVTPPPGVDPESIPFYGVRAPPISSDPPEHTWTRKMLLPHFSIKAVTPYEEETRELCNRLIDKFIDTGRADAAVDYAQQIPPRVIGAMLGVPEEMTDTFINWVRDLLEIGLSKPEVRGPARVALLSFINDQINERRKNPQDDLISRLLETEIDGGPVPHHILMGMCQLLVVAGIDTTWSSIGSALWHLAQHPEHRKPLIENPELMPNAVEELLRAYSPVTMARVMNSDYEYLPAGQAGQGCPMKTDNRVLMNFPAANRDPEKFENPDEVILDRKFNPHIAFGVGIHRCAGSNLARMEMRIAIEEWLKRIPDYRLEDPASVTWAGGQVRGPRQLAVVFP
jgi:cytochrome P450